jgi:hypothetical protein
MATPTPWLNNNQTLKNLRALLAEAALLHILSTLAGGDDGEAST